MSTHTPGPWYADGRLVVEGNKDAIAMVNIARPVDDAHADASLIASAPDLLRDLEYLLVYCYQNWPNFGSKDRIVTRIQTTIDKAKGKA